MTKKCAKCGITEGWQYVDGTRECPNGKHRFKWVDEDIATENGYKGSDGGWGGSQIIVPGRDEGTGAQNEKCDECQFEDDHSQACSKWEKVSLGEFQKEQERPWYLSEMMKRLDNEICRSIPIREFVDWAVSESLRRGIREGRKLEHDKCDVGCPYYSSGHSIDAGGNCNMGCC